MGIKSWLTKLSGADEEQYAENPPDSVKGLGISKGLKTVLLVEDEEITQRVVQVSIRKLGYECICFSDSKSAMKFLKENKGPPAHLIISDIMMDDGDGIDLLQMTREDERLKEIPFVFLSGASQDLFTGILESYAYDGFLTKPINSNDLSQILLRFSKNPKEEVA